MAYVTGRMQRPMHQTAAIIIGYSMPDLWVPAAGIHQKHRAKAYCVAPTSHWPGGVDF